MLEARTAHNAYQAMYNFLSFIYGHKYIPYSTINMQAYCTVMETAWFDLMTSVYMTLLTLAVHQDQDQVSQGGSGLPEEEGTDR